MVFLQLPYFTKEAEECEALFDKIIYVLKHMEVLKRMPWTAQEAVFQKLASIADVASLSKKERLAYDENLRKYRDTVAVMEGQWLEGHAKGVAEGHAKGAEDAKRDDARRMKADNMPTELIVKYTGLTVEAINSL
jgi:predicted transposase/invertase (TIGR01784 family)